MELLLNIVWLLIAVGVLGTWRSHWVYQRKHTLRHSLQEWTAVSVALILLFFAVSMTDDLHAEMVLSEDSSISRRGLSSSASAHPLPHSSALPRAYSWAIVPHVLPVPQMSVFWSFEPPAPPRALQLQSERLSGRAPPTSTL
jgi:hypothetical protein